MTDAELNVRDILYNSAIDDWLKHSLDKLVLVNKHNHLKWRNKSKLTLAVQITDKLWPIYLQSAATISHMPPRRDGNDSDDGNDSGDDSDGISDGIGNGISGDDSDGISDGISNGISGDDSDGISGDDSDGIGNGIGDGISGDGVNQNQHNDNDVSPVPYRRDSDSDGDHYNDSPARYSRRTRLVQRDRQGPELTMVLRPQFVTRRQRQETTRSHLRYQVGRIMGKLSRYRNNNETFQRIKQRLLALMNEHNWLTLNVLHFMFHNKLNMLYNDPDMVRILVEICAKKINMFDNIFDTYQQRRVNPKFAEILFNRIEADDDLIDNIYGGEISNRVVVKILKLYKDSFHAWPRILKEFMQRLITQSRDEQYINIVGFFIRKYNVTFNADYQQSILAEIRSLDMFKFVTTDWIDLNIKDERGENAMFRFHVELGLRRRRANNIVEYWLTHGGRINERNIIGKHPIVGAGEWRISFEALFKLLYVRPGTLKRKMPALEMSDDEWLLIAINMQSGGGRRSLTKRQLLEYFPRHIVERYDNGVIPSLATRLLYSADDEQIVLSARHQTDSGEKWMYEMYNYIRYYKNLPRSIVIQGEQAALDAGGVTRDVLSELYEYIFPSSSKINVNIFDKVFINYNDINKNMNKAQAGTVLGLLFKKPKPGPNINLHPTILSCIAGTQCDIRAETDEMYNKIQQELPGIVGKKVTLYELSHERKNNIKINDIPIVQFIVMLVSNRCEDIGRTVPHLVAILEKCSQQKYLPLFISEIITSCTDLAEDIDLEIFNNNLKTHAFGSIGGCFATGNQSYADCMDAIQSDLQVTTVDFDEAIRVLVVVSFHLIYNRADEFYKQFVTSGSVEPSDLESITAFFANDGLYSVEDLVDEIVRVTNITQPFTLDNIRRALMTIGNENDEKMCAGDDEHKLPAETRIRRILRAWTGLSSIMPPERLEIAVMTYQPNDFQLHTCQKRLDVGINVYNNHDLLVERLCTAIHSSGFQLL